MLLIDHDPKLDAVPSLNSLSYSEIVGILNEICPGIAQAARIEKPSASAGIRRSDTGEVIPGKGGARILIAFDDVSRIPEIGPIIFKRLVLGGYGAIWPGENGVGHIRTVIDGIVFKPERLDYIAPAVLGAGLERDLVTPQYVPGGYYNTRTFIPWSEEEEAQFKALIAAMRLTAEPRLADVREAYAEKTARTIMNKTGISYEEAIQLARKQIRTGDQRGLWPNHMLHFDLLGEVSVAEVIADCQRYNNQTLADPDEPEYGRGKAKCFVNGDGRIRIHSLAHGLSINYLVQTDMTIDAALENLKKNGLVQIEDDVDFKRTVIDCYRNPTTWATQSKRIIIALRDAGMSGNSRAFEKVFKAWAKEMEAIPTAVGDKELHDIIRTCLEAGEVSIEYYERIQQIWDAAPNRQAKMLSEHFPLALFEASSEDWYLYIRNKWVCKITLFMDQELIGKLDILSPGYTKKNVDELRWHLERRLSKSMGAIQSKYLLPFDDCILNIETGETFSHDPSYLLTWALPFSHSKDQNCEPILVFLREVFGGDINQVEVFRACLRAMLLGLHQYQKFIELVGGPGQGKSTLTKLLVAAIGEENTFTTSFKDLDNKHETANFKNKRLGIIDEIPRFIGDGTNFMALTGAGRLREERKYKSPTPGFVYTGWMVTTSNMPIEVTERGQGISRRRILFNTYRAQTQNPHLIEELTPFLPQWINWALAQADELMDRILRNPEVYATALAGNLHQAATETDPLALWVVEELAPGSTDDWIEIGSFEGGIERYGKIITSSTNKLFPRYATWCDEHGVEKKMSVSQFSRKLKIVMEQKLGWPEVSHDRTNDFRRVAIMKGVQFKCSAAAALDGKNNRIGIFSVTESQSQVAFH